MSVRIAVFSGSPTAMNVDADADHQHAACWNGCGVSGGPGAFCGCGITGCGSSSVLGDRHAGKVRMNGACGVFRLARVLHGLTSRMVPDHESLTEAAFTT